MAQAPNTIEVQDFQQEVVQASYEQPILADFWAAWCQPCVMLGPVLEQIAAGAEGEWRLAKVNVDHHPEAAQQYRIQGIPAVKLFYQGGVIGEFTGVMSEAQVRQWLQEHLPGEEDSADEEQAGYIQQAHQALANDEFGKAHWLLTEYMDEATAPKGELALLAFFESLTVPDRARRLLSTIQPSDDEAAFADYIRALAHQRELLDAPAQLPEHKLKATYLDAIQAATEHRFAAAIDQYITVIMQDRSYDDDNARRAVLAIFTLLGNDHPLVQQYRRRFDMALY
jgi:putative thioredoxin